MSTITFSILGKAYKQYPNHGSWPSEQGGA
jgi:hypothetical protein